VKISATIITRNEERNLPRLLASLGCCDEIVVVDSGSTDRTVEVAREHGARVLVREWAGYASQKNFAAGQAANAMYLGRWIHHSGWYPDAKVRLYDRRKGRWVGDYVHESVRLTGSTGTLSGDLLHFTCDSLAGHIARVNHYTNLAAEELAASGRRISLARLLLAPPWTFKRSYFLQRGFLDGYQGFLIACMAAFYVFAKYAKARWPEAIGDAKTRSAR
jgi:glycosyltransferase involved in cell wall biosynthesis